MPVRISIFLQRSQQQVKHPSKPGDEQAGNDPRGLLSSLAAVRFVNAVNGEYPNKEDDAENEKDFKHGR